MFQPIPITRQRAFLIHLLISLAIGLVVGATFWYVIYPSPLFLALGGQEIFFALLAIDVVLGPLMTLLLFKPGKKGLLFDLAVIACVQLAALFYGVFTLYSGRPVYVAALGHRFDVIQASEVEARDLSESGQRLPMWGPTWVGIREETDAAKRSDLLFSALAGVDYGHKPQYHAPLDSMKVKLLAEAKPIAELRLKNPAADTEIVAWLRARGHSDETARYLGLKARARDMAVVIDAKTATVVGTAPFKPWD
jgi:hypothetical protein